MVRYSHKFYLWREISIIQTQSMLMTKVALFKLFREGVKVAVEAKRRLLS